MRPRAIVVRYACGALYLAFLAFLHERSSQSDALWSPPRKKAAATSGAATTSSKPAPTAGNTPSATTRTPGATTGTPVESTSMDDMNTLHTGEAASRAGAPQPELSSVPGGFCVLDGRVRDELAVSLLVAALPLHLARNFCSGERACAGYEVRIDSSKDTLPSVNFLRRSPSLDEAMCLRASRPEVRFMVHSTEWLTFIRSEACAPPAATSKRAQGISLVTQLSWDRSWMLLEMGRRWQGPIVAAVTHQSPTPPSASDLPADLAERVTLLARRHGGDAQTFPINALRNEAIEAVATTHYLLVDVDLWPSESLLHELQALDEPWWQTPRLALVIPAFQAIAGGQRDLPFTLAELRHCIRAGACTSFKGQLLDGQHAAIQAVAGQQLSTDYARWWLSASHRLPYRIPCFDKISYEPYLVLSSATEPEQCAGTPRFDERYTGYGKNKVAWVQKLRAAGFSFYVLPRTFLTHMPHHLSHAGRDWQRDVGGHKREMDALFSEQVAQQTAQEATEASIMGSGRCRSIIIPGSRIGNTTPICRVPLMQVINPLDPSYAGRRTPAVVRA